MKRIIAIILAFSLICGVGMCADAVTYPAGGLVSNSACWKNLNFDEANELMRKVAYDDMNRDFILVHYSRNCYYCQQVVPQIKSLADQNGIMVYGIDAFNQLESELSYFYDYGNYFAPGSRGYAIVYMYNSRIKKMTAQHTVHDIMTFMQIFVSAGIKPIRREPYTTSEYTRLKDGYKIDIGSVYGFKNEALAVAAYDENDRLVNVSFPEINGGKSYSVTVPYFDIDYVKILVWKNTNDMTPIVDAEILEIND